MKCSCLYNIALLASTALSQHAQVPFDSGKTKQSSDQPKPITPGVIRDPYLVANTTYDYVIAGGGLTGLTVAAKLLENPSTNFTVLVIENGFYGSEYGPIIDDLNTYGQIFGSSVDHAYETSPQKVNNRVEVIRSGNGLGGSTLINGGTWTRPHKVQVDSWSKVFGNTKWTWDELDRYMKEIEKPRDPTRDETVTSGAWHTYNPNCHNEHNSTGRVSVGARDRDRNWSQVIPALMRTVNHTYPDAPTQQDLCCGNPRGVSMFMNTLTAKQVRTDAARSWLGPVLENKTTRNRITVLTGQIAGKVNLEKKDPKGLYKATGVEYGVHNKEDWRWNVTAKQEVLLAAGSSISPLILQYSGIGPKQVLEQANVTQKLDLPVGLNLQDQTTTNVRSEVTAQGNGQGQRPSSLPLLKSLDPMQRNTKVS